MTDNPSKPDTHIYNWVFFHPETVKLFVAALRYYQARLEGDLAGIRQDPELFAILDEAVLNSFPVIKELDRIKRAAEALQQKLESETHGFGIEMDISHGSVRYLKSVSLLYLAHVEKRRNDLAKKRSLSTAALQAIDTRLTELGEKLTMGVFKDAEPWPLLVEELPGLPEDSTLEPQVQHITPPPRIVSTIELLDPQIRERCLDLVDVFEEGGQAHRFDTVISEATRILEDRIRRLCAADSSLDGIKLISYAFGGSSPRLRLSDEPAEQEAAHLMFRGVFGLIRNPFHHRLIEGIARERVIQILGLIDYLIYLAESATPNVHQDAYR